MKKLLSLAFVALSSLTLFASDPVAVNEKVLQNFQKSFSTASDVTWYDNGNSFEVKFIYNEVDSRITYLKDGTVTRVVRYYGEGQLPLMLRTKLQKEFDGKTVFGVTEFSQDNEIAYFIILEDATGWSHVKCTTNGEMRVYKELKKS